MSREADIAWAAGLFEGEGCIVADPQGHLTLTITSTDRDVILRFAQVVGCGIVGEKQLTPRPGWQSQKPQWRWRLHKRLLVIEVVKAFWPYLGERRRARFQELHDLLPAYRAKHAIRRSSLDAR